MIKMQRYVLLNKFWLQNYNFSWKLTFFTTLSNCIALFYRASPFLSRSIFNASARLRLTLNLAQYTTFYLNNKLFWKTFIRESFSGAFQIVAVDVLRTIEYLLIDSLDIVSLTGKPVTRRTFISIEQSYTPIFVAHRASTQKRQVEIHPQKISYFCILYIFFLSL